MCAIAGLIGLHTDDVINRRMLQTMKKRGPDSHGAISMDGATLLHTRLSVIDPQGGIQPMECNWNHKDYVIVYNGELYNTNHIRLVLTGLDHEFKTNSDTEVVLHAFCQWGEECLQLLNGIFAFGVWCKQDHSLFLARDRMGVKPLFYKIHETGLLFASEIKTILAYPGVQAQIDRNGILQIIMLGPGRMPGSGVFKDIFEVEPGCCGWYRNGKLVLSRYWKLEDRYHTESFDETAEHVRYLVSDAISRQMVSDVPIGAFLSGGLDSSLISSVCSNALFINDKRLTAFSLNYTDHEKYFKPGKFQPASDTQYITQMEKYLNADVYWTVLETEDLIENLEAATIARDLPGMADVDSSLLAFCGQIRQHVKVALSGECADEIFGGYPWYRDPDVRAIDGFPWAQNTGLRAMLLQPWVATVKDAEQFVRDAYNNTLKQCDILPDNSPLERRMKEMMNLNYRWFMQTLLDRKDRMSMFHGLEVRVPFCDYRIAEYLYAVPWEYKDYNGYEKGLLRYAMKDYLPEEILWRKKSPYPKTYDPKYSELVMMKLQDIMKNGQTKIWQIVDQDALLQMLEKSYAWPWYGQLMQGPQVVAYMLQINFWMEHYGIEIV